MIEKRTKMKKNNSGIDFLKLILSFLVVFIHCNPLVGTSMESQQYLLTAFIRLAVPSFFFINGYFLKEEMLVHLRRYLKKSIPMFVFWSLIYSIFYFSPKISFLFFFAMGLGHLWYVSAMIIGVVLLSFIFKTRSHSPVFYVFLYLVGTFLFYAIQIVKLPETYGLVSKILEPKFSIRNGLFDALPFIGIGYYFKKKDIKLTKKVNMWLFLVSLVLLIIESYFVQTLFLEKYISSEGADFMIMLFPCSILLVMYFKDHLLYKKSFVKIRQYSVLIYFIHYGVNFILSTTSLDSISRTLFTILVTLFCSKIVIEFKKTRLGAALLRYSGI